MLAGLALVVAVVVPATSAQDGRNDVDLVSRASGATGARGNLDSLTPALSADGRSVAFDSRASNLTPDATVPTRAQVFVRDLQTGTTALVSRATGATGGAGTRGGAL